MAFPVLHRGDVLFTMSTNTALRAVIYVAQKVGSAFGGGAADAVHAAIVVRPGKHPTIVESVGGGVRMVKVANGNYQIFHNKDDDLRKNAAWIAEGFAANRQNRGNFGIGDDYGEYNTLSAALSPFRAQLGGFARTENNSPFALGPSGFFCSNLVFLAYAGAAETLGHDGVAIKHGRKNIGPRDLMAAFLDDGQHWTSIGQFAYP
jgi:hypothetical protein